MLVFVYGTLKSGFSNHRFLEHQELIGSAILGAHALYDVSPNFPGIVPSGRDFEVHGEVYSIDSDCLNRLDRLESNGSMYQRQELSVELSTGAALPAWVYIWKLPLRPDMPLHSGSDWIPPYMHQM